MSLSRLILDQQKQEETYVAHVEEKRYALFAAATAHLTTETSIIVLRVEIPVDVNGVTEGAIDLADITSIFKMNAIRKIKIKLQVWCGKAVDIWSKSPYPADVLSNLHDNGFCYDGMECGSMEGFLQSLKQKDVGKQCQVCRMTGREAKRMTNADWQTSQTVWWNGQAMTILTEREFCGILMDFRDSYDLRDKTKELEEKSIRRKKLMYLHGFGSSAAHQFDGITEADRKQVWGMFADNDQQVNGESLFLQYYNQVIHFSGEHRMDDRVIEDVLVPLIYRCVAK